jgi:hypothetical protein
MRFRRITVRPHLRRLALAATLVAIAAGTSPVVAGQPPRSCHGPASRLPQAKVSPVRPEAVAPLRKVGQTAQHPTRQIQDRVTAQSDPTAPGQPKLDQRLGELSERMQRHVETCDDLAKQAAKKQEEAQTASSAADQSIEHSRRLILFARDLLTTSGQKITLGERELTPEQLGSLLATLVDEHQKLLEQQRQLRIEAAAAAAKRQGADEQLARWRQQQAELLRLIDSLVTSDALAPGNAAAADKAKLAEDLASRLETLLPPPAP